MNRENQAWAHSTFSPWQLESLLNIAVNQAILRPKKNSCPGSHKGHIILYEPLVEMKDSKFKDVVDEEFKKRLNNGRFWEGLGNPSYRHLENSLTEDLDPEFAEEGYEMMQHAAEQGCRKDDLKHLTQQGLDNYIAFVERLELPEEKMVTLLKPYLTAILGWDREMGWHLFRGTIDFDDKFRPDFREMISNPFVQKYLKTEELKAHVADHLKRIVYHGNNTEGDGTEFLRQVFSGVPQPEYYVKRLQEECNNTIFFERQKGLTFSDLISP